jgi:hypothetical protein
MPRHLPPSIQATYSDLLEQAQEAAFEQAFAESGRFTKKTVKGRLYWYFRDETGREAYVGPDSDELRERVDRHRTIRSDERRRRTLVSMLKRAGLPSPPPQVGEVLAALARAGVFRLRACIVGTHAFGVYPAILGIRVDGASARTQDLDLAQFHPVSVAIAEDEKIERFVDVLHQADPTYRPISKAFSEGKAIAYVNAQKYKVELLAPNRGADRDEPISLPALGSHAQGLRFLDFLIYGATPAVLLHGPGVVVNVPTPERFAVHKLIVAHRRVKDRAKVLKDLSQAAQLIDALWEIQRADLLAAFREAADRGPAWREALDHSVHNIVGRLPAGAEGVLQELLA